MTSICTFMHSVNIYRVPVLLKALVKLGDIGWDKSSWSLHSGTLRLNYGRERGVTDTK